jgi:hypothetical protein
VFVAPCIDMPGIRQEALRTLKEEIGTGRAGASSQAARPAQTPALLGRSGRAPEQTSTLDLRVAGRIAGAN